MRSGLPHSADLELVERCLAGEEEAVSVLRADYAAYLEALLVGRGATPDEAEEIVADFWAGCFSGPPAGRPLLERYSGTHSLKSWFSSIVINRWISLRRKQDVRLRAAQAQARENSAPAGEMLADPNVSQILRRAIRDGLAECPVDDSVLLRLVHAHELTQREVARLFGWSESALSRRLAAAADRLAAGILRRVREEDRYLEVGWRDVLDLCEAAVILSDGADQSR
jgi:RNA polymerase sigma factor (sigma-70 family)